MKFVSVAAQIAYCSDLSSCKLNEPIYRKAVLDKLQKFIDEVAVRPLNVTFCRPA